MGFRIRTLAAEDPADAFPDPRAAGVALGYPEGLLAIGGDLSPARLLAAYRRGIFPWYNEDQPILWWSPDPRAILPVESFHMSRSLARLLRRGGWEYSLNQDFAAVIDGCSRDRGPHGTWITPAMRMAYERMHGLGYAHSVECWHDGELAGGVYGIRLGQIFFGESMFSARTNGSKVALAALAWLGREAGIATIDCQLESPHLATLGMRLVPRDEFLERLDTALDETGPHPDWRLPRQPAAPLAGWRSRS